MVIFTVLLFFRPLHDVHIVCRNGHHLLGREKKHLQTLQCKKEDKC